jgi:Tol biopolymer transport system component
VPENNVNLEIYSFDLKTRKSTRLTRDAANDFSPSWTPNGKSLLWIRGRAAESQIFQSNSKGENVRLAFPNVKGALRLQTVAKLPAWEKYRHLAIEPLAGKDK